MPICPARSTQRGKGPSPTFKHGMTTVYATSCQVSIVINRKQANDLGMVVTSTPTFNLTPLVIFFDSGATQATHSFISLKVTTQIGMESHKQFVDLYVNMPAIKMINYSDMYRNCPIILNQEKFEGDLIQLDLLEFDIILGMNWLSKHGAKIDSRKQRVTLKGKG